MKQQEGNKRKKTWYSFSLFFWLWFGGATIARFALAAGSASYVRLRFRLSNSIAKLCTYVYRSTHKSVDQVFGCTLRLKFIGLQFIVDIFRPSSQVVVKYGRLQKTFL